MTRQAYNFPVGVKRRTWPYGTRKTVDVLSISHTAKTTVVGCVEPEGERGAFLLVRARGAIEATEGQRREIIFRPGGPTGGYWDFVIGPLDGGAE
jgi:hypothetical protein